MLVFDVCLFVSMFDWVVLWMIEITLVLAFEGRVCDEDCSVVCIFDWSLSQDLVDVCVDV